MEEVIKTIGRKKERKERRRKLRFLWGEGGKKLSSLNGKQEGDDV